MPSFRRGRRHRDRADAERLAQPQAGGRPARQSGSTSSRASAPGPSARSTAPTCRPSSPPFGTSRCRLPGPCASASARCWSGRSPWSTGPTTPVIASCRCSVHNARSCDTCGRCPIAAWRQRSRRRGRSRRGVRLSRAHTTPPGRTLTGVAGPGPLGRAVSICSAIQINGQDIVHRVRPRLGELMMRSSPGTGGVARVGPGSEDHNVWRV